MATPDRSVLEELVAKRSFRHNGQTYPIAHATPIPICEAYADHIAEHGLSRVLEIGTLFGLSTLFLAHAAAVNGGHVDTIDIRYESREWTDGKKLENVHQVAQRLVEESGLSDYVTFHSGNSNAVLPELIKAGHTYDFALIDGSHVYAVVLLDFIGVDRLLDPGGFVALDDVGAGISAKAGLDGGPNRLLETLLMTGRYEITPWTANVAVCRKLRD